MSHPSTPIRAGFHSVEADGVKLFYREAGPQDAPVMLLLHGFPSSSHMFRDLIPLLATRYRVIAPDLPGFGFTEVPAEPSSMRSSSSNTRSTSSTTARPPACAWPPPIRNA